MTPIDFRNETFESLKTRLAGLRRQVWLEWLMHGPATTRQCAEACGIDLLTFRPRTTELYQMGAIELVENPSPDLQSAICNPKSSEGIYRARTDAEWRAWHAGKLAELTTNQLQLI